MVTDTAMREACQSFCLCGRCALLLTDRRRAEAGSCNRTERRGWGWLSAEVWQMSPRTCLRECVFFLSLCAVRDVGAARVVADGGMGPSPFPLSFFLAPFRCCPCPPRAPIAQSRGHRRPPPSRPLAMRTHKGLLLTWYNDTRARTLATSDLQRGRHELNAPSGSVSVGRSPVARRRRRTTAAGCAATVATRHGNGEREG